MSYWVLERKNLDEPFPLAHGRRWGNPAWSEIVGFHHFTLWLILLAGTAAVLFMPVAAVFMMYAALRFQLADHSLESLLYLIAYTIIGALFFWGTKEMVQTDVRLFNFLRRGLAE